MDGFTLLWLVPPAAPRAGGWGGSVLFRSWSCGRGSFELSRLLNSDEGRHAARTLMELAGTVRVPPRERLGLNGSRRESMCQLAISTLRATADLAALLPPRLARSEERRVGKEC